MRNVLLAISLFLATPVLAQTHINPEDFVVYAGDWAGAVEFMADETRRTRNERSFIYVVEEGKLFDIASASQSGRVESNGELTQTIIRTYLGEKRVMHTHINYFLQDLVNEMEVRVLGTRTLLKLDAPSYCISETEVPIEDQILSCTFGEEIGPQEAGQLRAAALENKSNANMAAWYAVHGTLIAQYLASPPDINNSNWVRLLDHGNVETGIVVVHDSDATVVWHETESALMCEITNCVEQYGRARMNITAHAIEFTQETLREVLQKAEELGISHHYEGEVR